MLSMRKKRLRITVNQPGTFRQLDFDVRSSAHYYSDALPIIWPMKQPDTRNETAPPKDEPAAWPGAGIRGSRTYSQISGITFFFGGEIAAHRQRAPANQ